MLKDEEYEFGSRYLLLWIAFFMGLVFLIWSDEIQALADLKEKEERAPISQESQGTYHEKQDSALSAILDEQTPAKSQSVDNLAITKVDSSGLNDSVELTNLGEETVNLGDYTLTDSEKRRIHSTFKDYDIAPQESIIIYCKNYFDDKPIGQPQVNFSIKNGEFLSLYQKDMGLVQSVEVVE